MAVLELAVPSHSAVDVTATPMLGYPQLFPDLCRQYAGPQPSWSRCWLAGYDAAARLTRDAVNTKFFRV